MNQLHHEVPLPVHESVSVRSAAVREEEGDLVGRHRHQRDEVPEHVRVLQVGGGVPLLGVDEAGEEEGVADEEDGGVVAHTVPVALLGVELDGEASRIPGDGNAAWRTDPGGCDHLAVSAEPLSPPTVEKRTARGVCLPTCSNAGVETYQL